MSVDALSILPRTNPGFKADVDDFFANRFPNALVQMNTTTAALVAAAQGGIGYTFDAATGVADPTPGKVRLNNATQNLATQIVVDLVDAQGIDRTTQLTGFSASTSTTNKGSLSLQTADGTKRIDFNVTGITYPAGYVVFTGSVTAYSAASPFTGADSLALVFRRTGDKGDVGSLGVGAATPAAGNVVLTNASLCQQRISATRPGCYVQLPDATTMPTVGTPIFVFRNTGEYPIAVQNASGTVLGWSYPGETCAVGLHDKTTAAGLWDVEDTHLLAIAAQFASTTLSLGTTGKVQAITMDADRVMLLLGGTSCYAVVYTRSTGTFGTPTLVRSSLGAGQFWGILAAADKVLVLSDLATSTTTSLQGVVLSTVANAITVQTAANATTAAAITQYGAAVVTFNGVFAFSYVRGVSGAAVVALTVTGNVVAFGAEQGIGAATNNAVPPHLYASGTSLMTLTADRTNLTAKSFTNAGAALTGGTAATAGAAQTALFKTAVWGAHWLALIGLTTANPTAYDIALAGSVSSITTVSAGLTNVASGIDIGIVSATKAVVMGLDATADTNACINVLTDNGAGTISAGTQVVIAGSSAAPVFVSASGSNARLVSSDGISYVVDCSGSSAAVTQTRMLINTAQISTFAQADSYMLQRNFSTLLAGSLYLPLPSAGGQLSMLGASANSQRLLSADFMPCGTAGCVGADATEAWAFTQPMTNGVFLQLIKAGTPA
jgi:hypothetical protein